jgi:catechol 2,3-dioxygenase-like lactoylglutathione lyase family enzyme
MKGYVICGIQQIGIGVKSLSESWKWYIKAFGMDCRVFEDEAEAKLMLPYTGGQPRSRHAVLAINLQGGGGFEIWQYKGREPVGITEQINLGDLGILGCKMKVRNIDSAYSCLQQNDVKLLGAPVSDPSGNKTFFLKDPWDNIFQCVEGDTWFMNEGKESGGSYGALIGVSDIERSKAFYSDILGYDEVVYDLKGVFPDLSNINGGTNEVRRMLLKSSKPATGPFSRIFGTSVVELIASTGRPGKKIYEGRFWGDLGFIHMCFDIRGMDELRQHCSTAGFPFTVDSQKSQEGNIFDMGEAAGHFAYIEDPDGTLIEFVETHKVPILKKLGWYLDMSKRDPNKSLPDWILKTMRFSRVNLKSL